MSVTRDDIITWAKTWALEYSHDWRIITAIAALESGWGSSALAAAGNNLCGMKHVASMIGREKITIRSGEYGDDAKYSTPYSDFVKYAKPEDSIEHLARTLAKSSFYEDYRLARDANMPLPAQICCIALWADGKYKYAHNPTYIMDILRIVARLGAE